MKQVDDIQKRMPYAESEEYLDQLISKATEKAIEQARQPKTKVRSLHTSIAAAAAALLLVAIGVTQFRSNEEQLATVEQESIMLLADNEVATEQDLGPIDEFLNGLSDEEAQLLAYYDIEEIPEYE